MVGHDQVGLEAQLGAEAVARRAGAGRRVEREQPRLDLVDGEAGDRAGEARREGDALVRLVLVAQDVLTRVSPLGPHLLRSGRARGVVDPPSCGAPRPGARPASGVTPR